jgi:hypothetical protein
MKSTPVATAIVSLVKPAKAARADAAQAVFAPPVFSMKLIAERGSTTPQVRHEIHDLRYDSYAHYGLNE